MSPNGPSSPALPAQPLTINVGLNGPAIPPISDERPIVSVFGMPLKYVSLITLAVQNAALTIIMHTSRVSTPQQYSAASAVLLNELLKGSISFAIAFSRIESAQVPYTPKRASSFFSSSISRCRRITRDVFSPDCWKLSIPAILYVIQNNLQYVAASNLDAATFQVTYQMKILTTAAFSVLLLRKQLSSTKWISLFFLAVGVGVVQIQSKSATQASSEANAHTMNPFLGFLAVIAACFTSGLAGVYFEMVLKNSQADLWVRNVQLSLFSLVPALVPALFSSSESTGFLAGLFHNFGFWAWATVLTQVLGGLITAVVIKYADNILKGFATSLAIVISFSASVLLFDFVVTPAFLVGASIVLGATWLYNQPATNNGIGVDTGPAIKLGSRSGSALGSPVEATAPILGQRPAMEKRNSALVSARAIASALGLPYAKDHEHEHELEPIDHPLYSPSATPPASRPPSPLPSPSSRLGPPASGSRPSSRLAVPSSSSSTPYSLSRASSIGDISAITPR